MLWSETHPELGSVREYFGAGQREQCGLQLVDRSEERFAEWQERRRRMPDSHYVHEITRQEAFSIVACCWILEEFHGDMGLPVQ